MGIIIWLIIGGVVGWLACLIMKTDAQQGVLTNAVVGIAGKFWVGSCWARTRSMRGSAFGAFWCR